MAEALDADIDGGVSGFTLEEAGEPASLGRTYAASASEHDDSCLYHGCDDVDNNTIICNLRQQLVAVVLYVVLFFFKISTKHITFTFTAGARIWLVAVITPLLANHFSLRIL
jgi:hypothetical protein